MLSIQNMMRESGILSDLEIGWAITFCTPDILTILESYLISLSHGGEESRAQLKSESAHGSKYNIKQSQMWSRSVLSAIGDERITAPAKTPEEITGQFDR
jgi:hypothetical protein